MTGDGKSEHMMYKLGLSDTEICDCGSVVLNHRRLITSPLNVRFMHLNAL